MSPKFHLCNHASIDTLINKNHNNKNCCAATSIKVAN